MSNREREERDAALSQEEEEKAADLSHEEEVDVEERRAPAAKIVHEAIRRQGIEELERPATSLLWSGVVAGMAMGMSVLAEAVLRHSLPESPAKPVLSSFGYTVGFLIVIMGRLQLFTESTVTAVLPLTTKPSWPSFWRTARLWAIVLGANLVGTFAFALYAVLGGFASNELTGAIVEVSHAVLKHDPLATLLGGIPSGFLIATIVWIMPSSSGQRIWIIMLITWLIALGGFAHVIAGSAEAWVLLLDGSASIGWVLGGFLLPAFIGNVIGGTGLFAFLAHAQVSREIHD
ncbi:formate/nitrite transporter family protein [Stakelama marina]|uniref:Formate/nitrite transporter family protein n=1 Tax=Stakelama marina TaxID=2826939 RepID=A0A8T4ID78_9SPHN|nr:formate/nitrite transporter family protein [Stakelama marina]MBR0552351.1 formate/nitrite transporter family protein [Stakelama marina]